MNVEWVMYAGIVIWVGIAGYLFHLSRKQADISRRVRQMELMDKRPGTDPKAPV